ncbi:MAG: ATP-binding protein [Treponema sp.]|nr:ATP-binding protein [Treponema sp.]MBR4631223.1 ATP-binding protein [Treponema sp.]
MIKISVRNFGPITTGYTDDDFLDISKLTVFIGNQGTGKSTLAKLFSTFSWIEKKLFIEQSSEVSIPTGTFIERLKFHKIDKYLSRDSEIEYRGEFAIIRYENGDISGEITDSDSYIRPKIQYIPAERNLVSVVDKYGQMPYLSDSLQDFLYTYDVAVQSEYIQNLLLPINELKIKYNRQNHKVELFNNDYSFFLDEASSGLQSFVPLFIVQKFLTSELSQVNNRIVFKNIDERKRLEALFKKNLGFMPTSDAELAQYVKENAHTLLNSCLVSILEEPEQNLFPISQKSVIFDMLSNLNSCDNNRMLITTHSPYFLPYINAAIKANEVAEKNPNAKEKIGKVIPAQSLINSDSVRVYEFEGGAIKPLEKVRNISSDDNLLNHELEETNELFRNILRAGIS